jgi:hypothetical protein
MERAPYFAETTLGAVVLVAIQLLSLPVLVGGLAALAIARLVSRSRAANPE